MLQTFSNRLLRVQLLAMKVMEATPSTETSGFNLTLHPGEPTELLVQLENLGTRSLFIDLRLESNCPASWHQVGVEGQELLPGRRMDAVLYFQIPSDFFENQTALRSGETLTIDYQGQVVVSYHEAEQTEPEIEYAALNLFVRPQSQYSQFLPTVYREVDFINRFLKIFEQAFEPVVNASDTFWAYLNPNTAPQALLPFLAHWVDWRPDPRWSVAQQRRLIQNAIEIYRWRGTRRGLRLFLHLYTNLPIDDHLSNESDKHICIEEATYKAFHLGTVALGQDTALGRGRPYHFIVRLRKPSEMSIDEKLIRYIIEQEKPAFCTYELSIVEG
ncbi:phage tail protein [Leptolyngbya sp. AN03gr2]|uniref:phage tail protein n=1 Tax=unclassified Leptolyngbya TaxID=2650499 RepID=UPI003D3147A6